MRLWMRPGQNEAGSIFGAAYQSVCVSANIDPPMPFGADEARRRMQHVADRERTRRRDGERGKDKR